MDLDEVGARLRAAREALKLTMEQMRDITGYSKSLISAAENGLKKPSTIYLFAMLDKFNVNINYIFSGKGKMFMEPEDKEKREKNELKELESIEGISSFIQENDNIRELFFLMEHVDMVRYAVLSFFIQYKTQNRHLIDELLEETRRGLKK